MISPQDTPREQLFYNSFPVCEGNQVGDLSTRFNVTDLKDYLKKTGRKGLFSSPPLLPEEEERRRHKVQHPGLKCTTRPSTKPNECEVPRLLLTDQSPWTKPRGPRSKLPVTALPPLGSKGWEGWSCAPWGGRGGRYPMTQDYLEAHMESQDQLRH